MATTTTTTTTTNNNNNEPLFSFAGRNSFYVPTNENEYRSLPRHLELAGFRFVRSDYYPIHSEPEGGVVEYLLTR